MVSFATLDLDPGLSAWPGFDHERESDQDHEPTEGTIRRTKEILRDLSDIQESLENIETDRAREQCEYIKEEEEVRGTDLVLVLVLVDNQADRL